MKKVLIIIVAVTCLGGVLWMAKGWTVLRANEKVAKFNADCDNLILGLQQYKEFVGNYPTGNNAAIIKSLLGRSERKVMILAVRNSDLNDRGEVLDPWGTPMEFYFSNNSVLIRSAGPNRVWEDAATPNADDLYRCARMQK